MLRNSRRSVALMAALAFAIACVGLVACSKSKLNAANYAKVNNGMSQAEVEAILGPGSVQASSSVSVPSVVIATPAPGTAAVPGAMVSMGASTDTNAKTVMWQEGQKVITITLINDKVIAKTGVGL